MLAALLHDIAKELPAECLRELAGEAGKREPQGLLHARAGAEIARREFGVTDEGILRAIAAHPTAEASPGPLLQLLFVSDYLEPTRDHLSEDDRRLLVEGLGGSLPLGDLFRRVLRRKLEWVLARGLPLHAGSVAAWNTVSRKG